LSANGKKDCNKKYIAFVTGMITESCLRGATRVVDGYLVHRQILLANTGVMLLKIVGLKRSVYESIISVLWKQDKRSIFSLELNI